MKKKDFTPQNFVIPKNKIRKTGNRFQDLF